MHHPPASAIAAAAMTVVAACGDGRPGEGELLRALGDDVDLVVVAAPRHAAGTWIERAAMMLAPGVPACVQERARTADTVAVTWSQGDGSGTDTADRDGRWSLVMIGAAATAAGCDPLERGSRLAWYGPDPRAGGRRFFASEERKRRWRALGDAPVRAIGDAVVQHGIAVHAAGTLDAGDGVAANLTLRFDERAAAQGATELFTRWVRELDRDRLGGAWPAVDWAVANDARDPRRATVKARLRVPGAAGEEAMIFATAALIAGDLGSPGAPCSSIAGPWQDQVSCAGNGRYTVAAAMRDQLLADPALLIRDARVVPAIKNGSAAGFKLYAIRPSSLLVSLGFANGDRVHTIAGIAVSSPDRARDVIPAVRGANRFAVELERRGRDVVLRFEVR